MSVAQAESVASESTQEVSWRAIAGAYFELTKPRITAFVVITALFAAIVAQRGLPSFHVFAALAIGLALSSGGSAAINMWYDRDIDRVMKRTQNRPIPSGLVPAPAALWFGITLGVLSVVVCAVWLNVTTAVLSAAGYLYYAVIYTMWLKRSTPQNIVIGGGAGSVPPLMGWAAVTGHLSPAAWLMFALIFLWTPPHFWSLALMKNEDYKRAGVPMMPVVRGARSTKVQCVWYAVVLWLCGIALYFTGAVDWVYVIPAVVVGGAFMLMTIRMLREPNDQTVWVRRTFFSSLMYLPAMFAIMVAGAIL